MGNFEALQKNTKCSLSSPSQRVPPLPPEYFVIDSNPQFLFYNPILLLKKIICLQKTEHNIFDHSPTVTLSHSTMVPQSHDPTEPWSQTPMVPKYHGLKVPLSHSDHRSLMRTLGDHIRSHMKQRELSLSQDVSQFVSI